MLACGTSCLYMTRLLKTPIIGPWPAIVASSWIDIEAGLSKKYILRMPPRFCASAVPAAASAESQRDRYRHQVLRPIRVIFLRWALLDRFAA